MRVFEEYLEVGIGGFHLLGLLKALGSDKDKETL